MLTGLRATIFGIVMVLVASACGSSAKPTLTPTSSSAVATATSARATAPTLATPTATRVPTVTAAPQPTSTLAPVSSGDIIIALPTLDTFVLNPGAGTGSSAAYVDPMYTYQIGTTVGGALDPSSGFLSTWTANQDSSVWTFKVRNNLIFHNGDRGTSQDAAYPLQLAADPNIKFARGAELNKSYTKLETPDDATMVATLSAPDIFWNLNYLARMPPISASPKVVLNKRYTTAVGQSEANKNPVGSGPYKFKSVTVGDRIVMEAVSSHFYYGVPRIKTLTEIGVPEEATRLALLQAGSADLSPISIGNVSRARQANLGTIARENSGVFIVWNSQYPDVMAGYGPNPLANETVRKALFWYAVDRKALVDSFLGGQGTPSMDYPVMKWDIAGRTPLPVPPFDPAKARSMLAEAGFAKGFEVDYYALQVSNPPGGDQIMEALAVYWENVGIKVKRIPYTGSTFTQALTAAQAKGGFTRPTVANINFIGNRQFTSTTSALNHDRTAIFAVNHNETASKLANDFVQAKNLDEYKQKGEAYRQYAYQHALNWLMLMEAHDIWARTTKITEKWRLGQDTPNFRFDDAAALR